jgi:hypothetical protein
MAQNLFRISAPLAALIFCTQALAQLPRPRLENIRPLGAQAGGQTELAIAGTDLDEAHQLIFSHAGIAATPVTGPPTMFHPEPRPTGDRFVVTVAPDVPPGIYDVRVVGALGVSNARRFEVGPWPRIAEQEPNDTPSAANVLPLETVVDGHCDVRNYDCFRISAAAGQRLTFHCVSRRLGSAALAAMILFDADDRELARSRPSLAADALLEFTAPAAGDYILKIHDFVHAGGPSHGYRLLVTAQTVEDSAPQAEPVMLAGGSVHPLPRLHEPAADEHEPNDEPAAAQLLTPPVQVLGRFHPAGDSDVYRFTASKGQPLAIELFSQRLGLATDPMFILQRFAADGSVTDLQEVDDITAITLDKNAPLYRYPIHHSDPAWLFTAPEDGTYGLVVRDLHSSSTSDPRNIYRLIVRPTTADFELVAFAYQSHLVAPKPNIDLAPTTPLLLRGGVEPVFVQVLRRPGFQGEVHLSAQGLPPGVTASQAVIPAWRNHGVILLAAATDAPPWSGPIQILGTTSDSQGQPVVRQARAAETATDIPTAMPAQTHLVSSLLLTIDAQFPAPVGVEAGDPVIHKVPRGGKLEIPIKLAIHGTMKGDLVLSAIDHHPAISIANITLNEAAPQQTLAVDVTATAPLGSFTFYLHGLATVSYQRNPAALQRAQQDQQRLGQLLEDLRTAQGEAPPSAQLLAAAEQAKKQADELVTKLTAATAARDLQLPISSPPLTVEVLPAPE